MAKDNVDSALVIGLGRFGFHVAKKFNELGIDVMGIDIKEDRVIAATDVLTRGLIGNTTNADFLKSCGVENFDLCVVTIGGDFEASLKTTWQLKQLGAKKVIARASSADSRAVPVTQRGRRKHLPGTSGCPMASLPVQLTPYFGLHPFRPGKCHL